MGIKNTCITVFKTLRNSAVKGNRNVLNMVCANDYWTFLGFFGVQVGDRRWWVGGSGQWLFRSRRHVYITRNCRFHFGLDQWFSNLAAHWSPLGELFKTSMPRLHPHTIKSESLGADLGRIHVLNTPKGFWCVAKSGNLWVLITLRSFSDLK